MKMIKKAKKGFTLIELVVVIAVIAILSGVSVVAYVGITNNAKQRACDSEASQLRTIILAADIDDEKFTCEGISKITLTGYEDYDALKASLEDPKSEYLKDMASLPGHVKEQEVESKNALVYFTEDEKFKSVLFEEFEVAEE